MADEVRFELFNRVRDALTRAPAKDLMKLEYSNLPKAAVAVILRTDMKGKLSTLLVKRRILAGDPWAGHMAFPGGRAKKDDNDMFGTARREVLEETSIDLRDCLLLGRLDEVVPSTLLNIRVTPFVVSMNQDQEVRTEEREIEDFVWVPLSFFADSANRKDHLMEGRGSVPAFELIGNQIVWGMTLKILDDLLFKIGPAISNRE